MKKVALIAVALASLFACQNNRRAHTPPPTIDTNLILPPAWTFGVIWGGYTDQQGSIDRVKDIMAHNYPIDAYWIDSWFWDYGNQGRGPAKYMDFVADTVGYPDRAAMWSFLEQNNIKGGFWVWDCIFETGNEEAFKAFDSRGFFGSKYYESNPWHNNSTTTAMFAAGSEKKGTLNGNIDFENPEAVKYFKERMKHFFDEGADFLKLDRTSAIPVVKTMFELSQEYGLETKGRGYVMSHSFGTESDEYKRYPGKWSDDTRTDWNVENPQIYFDPWVPNVAFKENIAMFADKNRKTSQIAFLTNDLGGFDRGHTDSLSDELFIRWLQFSIFNPIVELFSQPNHPTNNLPWRYSDLADKLFKEYSHLRMELFPYIYSYAHKTRLESKNMMRLLDNQPYEYLFGEEFFVAPVYERGATTRTAQFPAGVWVDYRDGKEYEGGRTHSVEAPLEKIPLFVRKGAIIPMRAYAQSIEKGTNDVLTLEVYPGADSNFELIEDDGTSNDYLKGIYAKTVIELKGNVLTINPVQGYYESMKEERRWIVKVGGKVVGEATANKDKKITFSL